MYKKECILILIFKNLSIKFLGNNLKIIDLSGLSFFYLKYEIFSLLKLFLVNNEINSHKFNPKSEQIIYSKQLYNNQKLG